MHERTLQTKKNAKLTCCWYSCDVTFREDKMEDLRKDVSPTATDIWIERIYPQSSCEAVSIFS